MGRIRIRKEKKILRIRSTVNYVYTVRRSILRFKLPWSLSQNVSALKIKWWIGMILRHRCRKFTGRNKTSSLLEFFSNISLCSNILAIEKCYSSSNRPVLNFLKIQSFLGNEFLCHVKSTYMKKNVTNILTKRLK
jgi:hypothetical protein